jgi:hypothetical protein
VRTISPSSHVRQPDLRYIDGGQSKRVRQSLEPLLGEVAEQLHADVCLALYEAFSSARETCMLAAVAAPFVGLPRRLETEGLIVALSQSASEHPSVRLPCWMSTIPSIASACTVSRATVRLTPYSVTISSEEGTPRRPDPPGHDLGGEQRGQLPAQALRLLQGVAPPRTPIS